MRTPSIIVLLAMAFLGGVAAYVVSVIRQAEPATVEQIDLYKGVPLDTKLLALDKRALDDAYLQHLVRLWNVWLSDGAKEAHRITNGLRIARQAYHQAAEQIAKREQELKR